MIPFCGRIYLLGLVACLTTIAAASEEECMAWAMRRIVGREEISLPDVVSSNTSESQMRAIGPGTRRVSSPGKRGAPGPQGLPGPVGPPGTCDCVSDVALELQRENEILKEQVSRIRLTSPETFCLLGLKDGTISNEAITSTYPSKNSAARLDSSSAWWPGSNNPGKVWVMVDIGRERNVTGVVTQGRADYDQWVTSYKVEYSSDGEEFEDVLNEDGSEMQVFDGNNDRNTKVVRRFPESVTTRFVRIYPMTYSNYMCMRLDVIDC